MSASASSRRRAPRAPRKTKPVSVAARDSSPAVCSVDAEELIGVGAYPSSDPRSTSSAAAAALRKRTASPGASSIASSSTGAPPRALFAALAEPPRERPRLGARPALPSPTPKPPVPAPTPDPARESRRAEVSSNAREETCACPRGVPPSPLVSERANERSGPPAVEHLDPSSSSSSSSPDRSQSSSPSPSPNAEGNPRLGPRGAYPRRSRSASSALRSTARAASAPSSRASASAAPARRSETEVGAGSTHSAPNSLGARR